MMSAKIWFLSTFLSFWLTPRPSRVTSFVNDPLQENNNISQIDCWINKDKKNLNTHKSNHNYQVNNYRPKCILTSNWDMRMLLFRFKHYTCQLYFIVFIQITFRLLPWQKTVQGTLATLHLHVLRSHRSLQPQTFNMWAGNGLSDFIGSIIPWLSSQP